MTNSVYANKISIQINDSARLVFMDERTGVPPYEPGIICENTAVVVLSIINARALRDLLIQYVKDDPTPQEVN